MRRILVAGLALLMVTGAAQAQVKKKTVCWKDEKGRRMCGDTVPPQYAKQERQVINERGVVVETKAREKTAEELAAEARQVEAAKLEEEQARYDSYLLQTYRKVDDLVSVRKERVSMLEGRLTLAEKAVVDAQVSVKTLHDRVDALKKAGKEPDKNLAKQVKDYDKGLLESVQAVEALKRERDKTMTEFDRDIARYQQLKPETAPVKP